MNTTRSAAPAFAATILPLPPCECRAASTANLPEILNEHD
jgi:hypothetical protein